MKIDLGNECWNYFKFYTVFFHMQFGDLYPGLFSSTTSSSFWSKSLRLDMIMIQ